MTGAPGIEVAQEDELDLSGDVRLRRMEMSTPQDGSDQPSVDRRIHRRLEIRLPVELRKIGEESSVLVRTITQNLSTGGMYLELDRADFAAGDGLRVQLTIPPMEGVSPYTGRANCTARVIRVMPTARDGGMQRFGIAAQFLDRLRISY
jgi:hypothetical protein